jgi:hypothetical protein
MSRIKDERYSATNTVREKLADFIRPKAPPPSYIPPSVSALPLLVTKAPRKPSWTKNISAAVLYMTRWGRRAPKPEAPNDDAGQDPRLLRIGIRTAPVSDYGPRPHQHSGANQSTKSRT